MPLSARPCRYRVTASVMMVAMDHRERGRSEERLLVLELLEAAMERRDEVFAIVDSSEDADEAQQRIRETFGVRDPHISRAVLDMQVSRWTRADRKRLADETHELRRRLND
jgi:DNA gyrase/topoisomerase IV subunit A